MRFVQVGVGHSFHSVRKVVGAIPSLDRIGLVLRRERTATIPVFTDVAACVEACRPDFLLSFAPSASAGAVARTAVTMGVPVLSLAPVAGGLSALARGADLASTGLVQVCDPSVWMPEHVARLCAIGSGAGSMGAGGMGVIGAGASGSGVSGAGVSGAGVSSTGVSSTGMSGTGMIGSGAGGAGMSSTGVSGAGMIGSGAGGTGMIGTVEEVQVWSTPVQHAVPLVRAYLGVSRQRAVVQVHRFSTAAPVSASHPWTWDSPRPSDLTVASVDVADGRSALIDVSEGSGTGASPTPVTRGGSVRGGSGGVPRGSPRLLVRGSSGHISGDQVVRLGSDGLITTTYLRRDPRSSDAPEDRILLGEVVLWTNPWPSQDWNDEELAFAAVMTHMASWVGGTAPPPGPLDLALFDHRLSMAISTAVREDRSVVVDP